MKKCSTGILTLIWKLEMSPVMVADSNAIDCRAYVYNDVLSVLVSQPVTTLVGYL